VTIIEPSRGWIAINWKDLWQYRELLYFLTWRDIKVRYKQTVLGALWAIIQPFMSMVVFTIFFGRLAGLDKKTGDIPYPIFVFAGLLPWNLFSQSLGRSSQSVVSSAHLITKVYFPRLIIPLSSVGTGLVDFAVAFAILAGMMIYYGVMPTLNVAMVLPLVFLTVVAALGVGMILSALNVAYRDVGYVVPFVVQLWMFATPVIYPLSIVPKRWQWVMSLNPLTGIIEGYRSAILGTAFDWANLGVSVSAAVIAFLAGIVYFKRVERQFADIV
jgi:lipopolysaccharide transport system permease protein